MANHRSNIQDQNEEEAPDTVPTEGELDDSELATVSGGTSFGVLIGGTTEAGSDRPTESLSLNYTKITF